jgi:hypothetical protein
MKELSEKELEQQGDIDAAYIDLDVQAENIQMVKTLIQHGMMTWYEADCVCERIRDRMNHAKAIIENNK